MQERLLMAKKGKCKKIVDPNKKYFNPRVRAEIWDLDYLESLPPKEKEYMRKFMGEWANASIVLERDPLIQEYSEINQISYNRAKKEMIGGGYKLKKKEGNPKKGHLHKTAKEAKEIFDNNNKRNNDLFGVTKINNLLEYDLAGLAMRRDIWHETDPKSTEETLIEYITEKQKIKKKDS